MSSNDRQDVPAFELVGDKLAFWMKSYHELDHKYQALKQRVASCHKCSSEEKDDEELPPAKRQRINEEVKESSLDSLEGLEPLRLDEILEIFKHFTGKELLEAMEVSKGWKKFIEGQKVLMNRAMSEVVMEPDFENCLFALFNQTPKESRPYKHMKAPKEPFPNNFKYLAQTEIIINYASTLETLDIDDGSTDDVSYNPFVSLFEKSEFCDFPKLRMLKYSGDFVTRLEAFSFPALTHLQVSDIHNDGDIYPMRFSIQKLAKISHKFPKLECFYATWVESDEDEESWKNVQWPKLKRISIPDYNRRFLEKFGDSLQVLEVQYIKIYELEHLMKNLKVHKSLTIGCACFNDDDEGKFEQNCSIEILKLNLDLDLRNRFTKNLLLGLPSLKIFVFFATFEGDLIKFIAANSSNLEKIICEELTEEMMQSYREIQRDAYLYKNTKFELIAEPDHDFEEIEKEFA